MEPKHQLFIIFRSCLLAAERSEFLGVGFLVASPLLGQENFCKYQVRQVEKNVIVTLIKAAIRRSP